MKHGESIGKYEILHQQKEEKSYFLSKQENFIICDNNFVICILSNNRLVLNIIKIMF